MGDKRAHTEAWGPAWSSWERGPSAQHGRAGTAGGLRWSWDWGNVNSTEWGGGVGGKAHVWGAGPPASCHHLPWPLLLFRHCGFISLLISSFIHLTVSAHLSVCLSLSPSLFPFSLLCTSVSFSDSQFYFSFYFCLFSLSLSLCLCLYHRLCICLAQVVSPSLALYISVSFWGDLTWWQEGPVCLDRDM